MSEHVFPMLRRPAVVALLAGASVLATPLAASAQAMQNGATTTASSNSTSTGMADRAEQKAETIDQRITKLHADLKITQSEEADWSKVAQVMRDNAANMEKLASEEKQSTEPKTAPEDLKTYAKFAQAHVDGLKSLSAAFDTLYGAMPADQKKNADEVFQNHMQASNGAAAHG